jgi:putative hydrolase
MDVPDSPADRPDADDWQGGEPEPGDWADSPEAGIADLLRQAGVPVEAGANLEQMLSQLARQLVQQLRHQSERLGAGPGDPVVWTAAKEAARSRIASLGPDPAPDGRKTREIADAVHLVELWLDKHTIFTSAAQPPAAWSRAEWINQTLPAWRTMIEPVVSTIAKGLEAAMGDRFGQAGANPEIEQIQQFLQPVLRRAADSMFGTQLGRELGRLATETVTATDLGFPLLAKPQVAVLPTNLAAFADGLALDEGDILLYHAIREAARQRLFHEVAWIGPQLVALVQHYAREIRIDPEALSAAIEESVPQEITRSSVDQFEVEVNSLVFEPGKTPEQLAILERLETFLALLEGWVDDVALDAASVWMPSAAAMAETIRRRRAAGGAGSVIFGTLLGLEVRPQLFRQAQGFWAAIRQARQTAGRDELWRHPDDLPASADLADPAAFLARQDGPAPDDPFDLALRRLLDGEDGGPAAGETAG